MTQSLRTTVAKSILFVLFVATALSAAAQSAEYSLDELLRKAVIGIDGTIPFDSATWKDPKSLALIWFHKGEYDSKVFTTRQKMLKEALLFVREKTKPEIEAVLGPGLRTSYFSEMRPELIYMLGPERGTIPLDSEWLAFWFHEDGSIRDLRILRD